MRIVIFSSSYRPEPTGIGPVTGELADGLASAGHEVHVIAANPAYPDWKLPPGYSKFAWSKRREGTIEVHRCPVYIPGRIRGLTRVLYYGSFAASALFPAAKLALRFRPDLVIQVAPTLIAAPLALLTAKLSGARSWVHVQDFEVEAGFATGELNDSGVIARSAKGYEHSMLKRFDRASSISPEMCAKLIEKGCKPENVYELRNWTNIEQMLPGAKSTYREEFGIKSEHVMLYSGAMSGKQGIEMILEAADELAHRNDITFLICGAGSAKAELEARAATMPNVQIHDLQPKARLPELLSTATIHLLPQRNDAADLVLPSKLANMLASGRPVIAGCKPGTGLAREVEGVGLTCEPEDGKAMARAIETLLADTARRSELGAAARLRATERWSRESILAAFEKELAA